MKKSRSTKSKTSSASTARDRLTPAGESRYLRVAKFFETVLRHSKGQIAGQPFLLLPWQHHVLRELFGRLNPDGTRQRRVGYIEVPKKQGKSTLLAGLALYLTGFDGEAGSEVYGAASDREQAGIIYREAASMVRASPALSRYFEVIDSRKTILHKASNSFYRVLSADAFRAEGLNIHALLFDELHAQRDRRLWDALRYGGAARRQPLILSITTAGHDRNSICFEQHSYARRCLADPTLDPSFFGCIYAAPDTCLADGSWKTPEVWHQANPSLGHTITLESFAADAREAELSASKLNSFLRYRLNVWTQQDTRWIKPEAWTSCRSEPHEPLEGRDCWVGVDLAWSQDTTAVVAIFPDSDGGIDVLAKVYLPADLVAEHERRDRVQYGRWATEGHVTLTDGDVTDYEFIRRDIEEMTKRFTVRMVAVDPFNATHLSNQLDHAGIPVNRYRQGFSGMNAPCRLLETLIANRKIRHNSPVLDWQASNVAIRTNAEGLIRPLKPKPDSSQRVDGILALCMALGAWSDTGGKTTTSEPQILIL